MNKKKFFTNILILSFLTIKPLLSQTFDTELSLTPHTDSQYGQWKLSNISAKKLSQEYKGTLVDTRDETHSRSPYYIEHTGIEIFQKKLYEQSFLKNGYYKLDWIAKKGTIGDELWHVSDKTKNYLKESRFFKTYTAQEGWEEFDWSMLLSDYINHDIKSLPAYQVHLVNNHNYTIKLIGFYAKTIFTTGGEASLGAALLPPSSQENLLEIDWNKKNILKLKEPLEVHPNESLIIPLSIVVKNAANGDGPGRITFGLYIQYIDGGKEKEELLTIISQSEDYGFETGW